MQIRYVLYLYQTLVSTTLPILHLAVGNEAVFKIGEENFKKVNPPSFLR